MQLQLATSRQYESYYGSGNTSNNKMRRLAAIRHCRIRRSYCETLWYGNEEQALGHEEDYFIVSPVQWMDLTGLCTR
jgi:hypothetical protein